MTNESPTSAFARFNAMRRRLGPAGPLAAVATFAPMLGLALLTYLVTATHLAAWMKANPGQAIPAYVGLFWILGLFSMPTYAYSILGGWAFGFEWGMVAAIAAYFGAASGAFAIARVVARDRVLPIVAEHAKLVALQRAVVGASAGRTLFIVSLIRLSPAASFALTNFVLGVIGLGWRPYLIGTLIGVVPRTAAVVWVASASSQLSFRTSDGWWMAGLGIVATVIAIGVLGRLVRRELDRQLELHRPIE